jgi:hypothetical protein
MGHGRPLRRHPDRGGRVTGLDASGSGRGEAYLAHVGGPGGFASSDSPDAWRVEKISSYASCWLWAFELAASACSGQGADRPSRRPGRRSGRCRPRCSRIGFGCPCSTRRSRCRGCRRLRSRPRPGVGHLILRELGARGGRVQAFGHVGHPGGRAGSGCALPWHEVSGGTVAGRCRRPCTAGRHRRSRRR